MIEGMRAVLTALLLMAGICAMSCVIALLFCFVVGIMRSVEK